MVKYKIQRNLQIFLIVLVIIILSFNYWTFLIVRDIQNRNKEDKQFLIEQNSRCWKELRKYDPNCWDTQDCSENPELQGCSKIECNVCCYNACTLMNCPSFNKGGLRD